MGDPKMHFVQLSGMTEVGNAFRPSSSRNARLSSCNETPDSIVYPLETQLLNLVIGITGRK